MYQTSFNLFYAECLHFLLKLFAYFLYFISHNDCSIIIYFLVVDIEYARIETGSLC